MITILNHLISKFQFIFYVINFNSQKQYANLQKRYRNIITRGESELPAIPDKPNGKQGKMAKSDAHNCNRIRARYQCALWSNFFKLISNNT